MNVRTTSVTKGPGEGVKLVKEIRARLERGGTGTEVEMGSVGLGAGMGGPADSEHAGRMRMALEKAKMRNAGASSMGTAAEGCM